MSGQFDIAVVGANGLVGEALLSLLDERNFPAGKVYPLATLQTAGDKVLFKGKQTLVQDVAVFDFSQVQIAFFPDDSDLTAEYAAKAVESGCVVIDSSGYYRVDPEVTVVAMGANPHAVAEYQGRNIVATPGSSVVHMAMVLKPLQEMVGITRINIATYNAVSGDGQAGIEELAGQTAQLLNAKPITNTVFAKQIAFNVLPQVGAAETNGYTREEMDIARFLPKVLGDEGIQINATAAMVPVFFGHAAALHIELRETLGIDEVRRLLEQTPGVEVVDELVAEEYPTAVTEAAQNDAVYVGRIRNDVSLTNGINLWIVADNVRCGAALNSVQVAEILVKDYL